MSDRTVKSFGELGRAMVCEHEYNLDRCKKCGEIRAVIEGRIKR